MPQNDLKAVPYRYYMNDVWDVAESITEFQLDNINELASPISMPNF